MRKTKIATFGVLAAAMIVVPATPAFAYDVQSGDTLSEVAERHGTTWQELAAANDLVDPDRIFPGQHLEIGEGGAPRPGPMATAPPPRQQAPQQQAPQRQAPQQPAPRPQTQQESSPPTSQSPGQTSQTSQSQTSQASQAAPKRQSAAKAPTSNAAKSEIIRRESSGNPRAQNGKYHGLFQTDQAWGRGTVAQQHEGAERYVHERYGSWEAALRFHNRHGWY